MCVCVPHPTKIHADGVAQAARAAARHGVVVVPKCRDTKPRRRDAVLRPRQLELQLQKDVLPRVQMAVKQNALSGVLPLAREV